jgi:hypothetical protein
MRLLFLLLITTSALAVETWQPFGPGGGGWIEDVVAHPTDPKEVWAMTDLSGLFRSQDAGLTWRKMSADVERGVMARKQIVSHNRQFAIDPKEPLHMYWGTCGMIWASHDGGVTGRRPLAKLQPSAMIKRPALAMPSPSQGNGERLCARSRQHPACLP